jgi:hypothetical protein
MAVAAVALKLPLLLPACTLVVAGMVSNELLLPRLTLTPFVGAFPDSVTVHGTLSPWTRLVGAQERPEIPGVALIVTVPLVPAEVMIALPAALTPSGLITLIVVLVDAATSTVATTPCEITLLLSPVRLLKPVSRQVMLPTAGAQ